MTPRIDTPGWPPRDARGAEAATEWASRILWLLLTAAAAFATGLTS